VLPSLPIGGIGLWYGSVGTIPNNHQLCDGTNGTPDLRDKIPVGAGNTYNPGAQGGNVTHAHTMQSDAHIHYLNTTPDVIAIGANIRDNTRSKYLTGTALAENSLPPYKSLCYIQRIA